MVTLWLNPCRSCPRSKNSPYTPLARATFEKSPCGLVLMEGRQAVGSFIARVGLTGQLLGQIFLTPMAAFALTYLLVFSAQGGDFRLSIEVEMIPWIGLASLFYGMLALTLALGMGGFTPLRVIEAGGWRLAMGLTRHPGSSTHRFVARRRYAASAHGRLSMLVYDRFASGHALWTIRGSLVLLAIPFQVLLATIPLSLVLMFPEGVVHQNRQLELALLLYGMCLYVSIRAFPGFARRYIMLASLGRKFLGNTLRISWAFPVFLLWSMGQLSSYIVQRALGEDIALNIAFEKQLFESLISAGSTPETSFLNLLTALAVMPMAAFTTLAVLGGGAGEPPVWMRPGTGVSHDDTQDQIDTLSAGLDQLAADVAQSNIEQAPVSHTPAVVQQVMVPVFTHQEPPSAPPQDTSSLVDDLDFEKVAAQFSEPVSPPPPSTPSFDEPVIKGFDLETTKDT